MELIHISNLLIPTEKLKNENYWLLCTGIIVQIIFATQHPQTSMWWLCEGFTNRRFSYTPSTCEILLPHAKNEKSFIGLSNCRKVCRLEWMNHWEFQRFESFSFLSYSNKYMFYCGLGGSIYSGKLCPRWAYGGHLTGISKCGYWQPCKPLCLQQWHDPHHHAEHHGLFYDTCGASCTLACDPWIRVMQTVFFLNITLVHRRWPWILHPNCCPQTHWVGDFLWDPLSRK